MTQLPLFRSGPPTCSTSSARLDSRAYWLAASLLHLGGAYGATAWRSVAGCWALAGRMS